MSIKPKAVVSDGSTHLGTGTAAPTGHVVEAIIEGRLAWLIKPVPLERYTFTFELEKAHAFENQGEARDVRASVWCGLTTRGFNPTLTVVWLDDRYRAMVAAQCPATALLTNSPQRAESATT